MPLDLGLVAARIDAGSSASLKLLGNDLEIARFKALSGRLYDIAIAFIPSCLRSAHRFGHRGVLRGTASTRLGAAEVVRLTCGSFPAPHRCRRRLRSIRSIVARCSPLL